MDLKKVTQDKCGVGCQLRNQRRGACTKASLNSISLSFSALCSLLSFDVVLGKALRKQLFIINVKNILRSIITA